MKTSLVFLGILSTVFIANYGSDRTADISGELVAQPAHHANATAWKLSISGIENQCTTSFTLHLENLVFSQNKSRCAKLFPALQNLAGIQEDENGDITLYHEDGSKLVKFMESESADHESFWPTRPLMTLARVD